MTAGELLEPRRGFSWFLLFQFNKETAAVVGLWWQHTDIKSYFMSIFQQRNNIFVSFGGTLWHLLFQTYFSFICILYCNSAVCYRSICNKISEVNPSKQKYVPENIYLLAAFRTLHNTVWWKSAVCLSWLLFHLSVFCAVCLNPNDPHVSHLRLIVSSCI